MTKCYFLGSIPLTHVDCVNDISNEYEIMMYFKRGLEDKMLMSCDCLLSDVTGVSAET